MTAQKAHTDAVRGPIIKPCTVPSIQPTTNAEFSKLLPPTHTQTHTHTHTNRHTYNTHTHIHKRTHIYTHTHTHTHNYTHIQVQGPKDPKRHTHTIGHIYMQAHSTHMYNRSPFAQSDTHIHTHTHTHRHTQTLWDVLIGKVNCGENSHGWETNQRQRRSAQCKAASSMSQNYFVTFKFIQTYLTPYWSTEQRAREREGAADTFVTLHKW